MCKTTLPSLLEQALNGKISEEAFRNEFCKLYYNDVFAIARYFTNSNQDAEDVTNDVFLKKILELPLVKFQEAFENNIEGWIFVMVKRYCYTYFESNRKRRNQDEWDETTSQSCDTTVNTKTKLVNILENMPPRVKRIFILKSEGHNYKVISEKLGVSEAVVKMTIKRWRDKQ